MKKNPNLLGQWLGRRTGLVWGKAENSNTVANHIN